jgi:hypothetical protein
VLLRGAAGLFFVLLLLLLLVFVCFFCCSRFRIHLLYKLPPGKLRLLLFAAATGCGGV